MSPVTAPRALAGALALALAVVGTPACVAARRALVEPPRLFVNEEAIDDRAGVCGEDLDVATGALPDGAVVLTRYHVTTTRSVPLQQVLDLLAAYARKRCAHGIRVLRAEAADGIDGVVAAEAVAYALPAP